MEVILPGFSKAIFYYLCVVNTLELYLYIILGCVLFYVVFVLFSWLYGLCVILWGLVLKLFGKDE